ncbi:hypothetical protein [Desulfovibrio psychrotolerans]|uniref:Uncharacterized protein n=1 Tax=Desulfovibrio psychrotolerans TaxID=415242 RepID=A0A7J0BWN8_9BACT|nr:hypothetical protein [Desulfovibrio psychrotolerans]GFM38130.1 hypothetical protein DSM19430T_28140 [Desulfovibrio psychrotolerans]
MQPPPHLRTLFTAFSAVNRKAFVTRQLRFNFVLSKVPAETSLFTDYLSGKAIPKTTLLETAACIVRYYMVNMALFLFFCLTKLLHIISGQRCQIPGPDSVILDSYCVVPRILKSGVFADSYFGDIAHVLEQQRTPIVYLPRLYGSRNPLTYIKLFVLLKESGANVLTEYQLISPRQLLSLWWDLLSMPYHVLRLCGDLDPTSREQAFIRHALIRGLRSGHLDPCSRYWAAMRLGSQLDATAKPISWYENQSVDKAFSRGLRDGGFSGRHYGAQLLVWPATLLNTHRDTVDEVYDMTPDIVVVNGPYFLPDDDNDGQSVYRCGPSMRYKHIFERAATRNLQGPATVLLSYFHDETLRTLQAIRPLFSKIGLRFKFHPATNPQRYREFLPENATIVTGSLISAIEGSSVVIGSGTGTLAEAVALGIPAITVESPDRFCHNYLPPFGKGILWEVCSAPERIDTVRSTLLSATSPQQREDMRRQFRDLLFRDPTEEAILEAFDLRPNAA